MWNYDDNLNDRDLVGMKIIGLRINPEKTVLEVTTPDKTFFMFAVGDCCSHSWFENITGVDNLLGHTIQSVEDNYVSELTSNISAEDWDDQSLKFYSFIIKTDKGNFEIEYRNSSNGYYGGSIDISTYATGGWGRDSGTKELTPLMEDY